MNQRIDSWPVGLALFLWVWVVFIGGPFLVPDSLNSGWPVLAVLLGTLFAGFVVIMLAARLLAPEWSRRLAEQDEADRKDRRLAELDDMMDALKAKRRRLRK